uniref:Uncharacterized protein n=1 Tax=Arundo donax TaxID=35708 RepID=A0A0A9B6Y6_ARUDO
MLLVHWPCCRTKRWNHQGGRNFDNMTFQHIIAQCPRVLYLFRCHPGWINH